MQKNKLLDPFWIAYIFLVAMYFRQPLTVSWDPAEYLAYGKYIFSGYGFNAYYRPVVWPLLLGFLWKIGFPMPVTMKAVTALLYLAIPLVTFFSFRDFRRYLGLAVASQPVFFFWSHLPLSHVIAVLFIVLAYSTEGYLSGVMAALAGLSRFTFLIFSLVHVIGDKKKFLGGAATFALYFLAAFLAYGSPLAPMMKASEIISWSRYYNIWPEDPFFYIRVLLDRSPLLIPGFFAVSKYALAALTSFLFFTFKIYRKEDRFLIDVLPYLGISVSRYGSILLAVVLLNLVQLPGIHVYREECPYCNLIRDDSVVVGMHPVVNAYRNVHFRPWFDYFQDVNFTGADYCIFYRDAIPCTNDFCRSRVELFYRSCSAWDVLYNESGKVLVAAIPRRSAAQG